MRDFWYSPALPFTLALVVGLLYPRFAHLLRPYALYILMCIMVFSTTEFTLRRVTETKIQRKLLIAFGLNYGVLTLVILALAFLFSYDPLIRLGFVVMAAMPPAITVVPYSKLLNGNVELAMFSNITIYFVALGLGPFIIYLFTRQFEGTLELLWALALLILIPLALSRILRKLRVDERLRRNKTLVINALFCVLVYTLIGSSRDFFLHEDMAPIALAGFIRTLLIGTCVYVLAFKAAKPDRITYTLFASYKNLGASAVIALELFGAAVLVPSIICLPFEIALIVYYSVLFGKVWHRS